MHFTLFWDNIARYKTESVYVLGLMNSENKVSEGGDFECGGCITWRLEELGIPIPLSFTEHPNHTVVAEDPVL